MGESFAQARAKYQSAKDKARQQTVRMLAPQVGVGFTMSGWFRRAREAFAEQWLTAGRHEDAGWDWEHVFRRYNDPDQLDMVIWLPNNRLCGIGLGVTTSQAVSVRFIEGDPRSDCPLKGRRALIFLECAANYAQSRGKVELRIEPVNEELVNLYTEVYGFTLETPPRRRSYYKRKV
jgi:hypothetical protein